jgi:hypothetical protein
VSAHTGRVHLHLALDGSRPVGLSLPLELLRAHPCSAMLRSILDEHATRWSRERLAAASARRQRQQTVAAAAAPPPPPPHTVVSGAAGGGTIVSMSLVPVRGDPGQAGALVPAMAPAREDRCTTGHGGGGDNNDDDGVAERLSFVGPVGLVAPLPSLEPSQLAEGVSEAAAFVRDWTELRAVSRNRLYGAVLERYFQDALEAVTSEAVAAGAYGTSTSRYVQGAPVKVPDGTTLKPVQVRRGCLPAMRLKLMDCRQTNLAPAVSLLTLCGRTALNGRWREVQSSSICVGLGPRLAALVWQNEEQDVEGRTVCR